MAQITRDARTKEEEVGRARGRKIKGKRQGKGKILRATHNIFLLLTYRRIELKHGATTPIAGN